MLQLGLGSAALLALGGGAIALVEPGLRDGRMSTGARAAFGALGSALLDGSLPAEPNARALAVNAMLERVDALIGALPAHAQAELSQLLALLATSGGRRWLADLEPPWPQASVLQVQQGLQAMRTSSLGLRQQAYHALHDITAGAYFSDPSTWTQLGYPGPLPV